MPVVQFSNDTCQYLYAFKYRMEEECLDNKSDVLNCRLPVLSGDWDTDNGNPATPENKTIPTGITA